MHEWPTLVISSEARDLAFSTTCPEKISRPGLEMTIANSRFAVGKGEGCYAAKTDWDGCFAELTLR
jgi:hypothetical protein